MGGNEMLQANSWMVVPSTTMTTEWGSASGWIRDHAPSRWNASPVSWNRWHLAPVKPTVTSSPLLTVMSPEACTVMSLPSGPLREK